jgi:aspartate/methionine/tyrosine aminotransferase
MQPDWIRARRGQIHAAVDLARQRRLVIVTDESYERYVYDGASITSVLAVEDSKPTTVLIRSMSKSFAMSTWRIGS